MVDPVAPRLFRRVMGMIEGWAQCNWRYSCNPLLLLDLCVPLVLLSVSIFLQVTTTSIYPILPICDLCHHLIPLRTGHRIPRANFYGLSAYIRQPMRAQNRKTCCRADTYDSKQTTRNERTEDTKNRHNSSEFVFRATTARIEILYCVNSNIYIYVVIVIVFPWAVESM